MKSFQNYLHDPSTATPPTVEELNALVERYPWFTAARVVRSRAEGVLDPNLGVWLSTGVCPEMLLPSAEPVAASEATEVTEVSEAMATTDTIEVAVPEAIEAVKAVEVIADQPEIDLAPQEEPVEPTNVEWVAPEPTPKPAPAETPAVQAVETEEQGVEAPVTESFVAIDQFLSLEQVHISPPDRDAPEGEDLALSSVAEDLDLVSEELADIYMDQELYSHALDTYRTLCLLYPEKSVYFAELIAEAEQKNAFKVVAKKGKKRADIEC